MTSTTAMRQRFEALVERAEAEVSERPVFYKRRLMLLAALGYGVIFAALAGLIVLLGGTAYLAFSSTAVFLLLLKKKILFLLLIPIYVLARSLVVRVKAPEGLPLDRADYPTLWAEIDALRSKLGALPIHEVVAVSDMNAAVSQTPRLGLFGPYKNTLVLGLELLMSLSPAQARAVLAHEFGHLSQQHGRFGAWIYRKRLTWARIQAAFDQGAGLGTGLMRRFMDWYVPRLAGWSFALARKQEYEADAAASALTSRQDMASALVLTAARSGITHEQYWKPLLRRADSEAAPELHPYSRLFEHLKHTPVDAVLAESKVQAAMRVKTGIADTHPALKDRLAALDCPSAFVSGGETAAEAWLGPSLGKLVAHFDCEWSETNKDAWTFRHERAKGARERLKELTAKPASELQQLEAWEVATLIEEYLPDLDPLAAFRAYHAQYPDDPDARFVIGRMLLIDRHDPAGVAHLEAAAEALPPLREAAYGMISGHFAASDQHVQAEHYQKLAEQAFDEMQEARAERDGVGTSDRFQPTRFDDESLALLAGAIMKSSVAGKIKDIWVAEKVLRRMPDKGLHVVLLKPAFLSRGKDEIAEVVLREVSEMLPLPDSWVFLVESSVPRSLTSAIKSVGRRAVAGEDIPAASPAA